MLLVVFLEIIRKLSYLQGIKLGLKIFFLANAFQIKQCLLLAFSFSWKKRLHIFVIIERANVMSKSCEVCGRLKWTQKCNVHVCLSCEIASEIMNKFINLKTRNN